MKNDVNVLVLTGYGLNCDYETAYAFELAGARSTRVHINALIQKTVKMENFHILVFGGGFSWGDDHGAGVLQSIRMKTQLGEKIDKFIADGNLIIGICNGFQTLVNMGLLPCFDDEPKGSRSVALSYNDCGNFKDQWVFLKANQASNCIFTKGMDFFELPVRHGEGKFYSDTTVINRLIEKNQIVIQYATSKGNLAKNSFPDNPNGSLHDIAGICDPTGRIFGLMPHPEAYNHWLNHPDWTRTKEKLTRKNLKMDTGPTSGIRMFQNAVDYIRKNF